MLQLAHLGIGIFDFQLLAVFEFYVRTLERLAPGSTWTGAGIGKDQVTLARWSLELGGHCRTGLEDNVRMDRELCAEYGRRPATAAEARSILSLSAS